MNTRPHRKESLLFLSFFRQGGVQISPQQTNRRRLLSSSREALSSRSTAVHASDQASLQAIPRSTVASATICRTAVVRVQLEVSSLPPHHRRVHLQTSRFVLAFGQSGGSCLILHGEFWRIAREFLRKKYKWGQGQETIATSEFSVEITWSNKNTKNRWRSSRSPGVQ